MPDLPRHNLPAEPNRFVGRERDIDELCRLLGRARVVSLCGVGGIGKTRLALRVAARGGPRYPEGVWLVELARITRPELVVEEIARVLGVRQEGGRPLLDTLVARLRDGPCLLLLDNCEHLIDECDERGGHARRVLRGARHPGHQQGAAAHRERARLAGPAARPAGGRRVRRGVRTPLPGEGGRGGHQTGPGEPA
jgi:hypothetical protein